MSHLVRRCGNLLAAFTASAALAAAPAAASGGGGGSSSQQVEQNATAAAPAQRNRGDRPICVREQLTGSHVVETICKTRQQWEAQGGVPGEE